MATAVASVAAVAAATGAMLVRSEQAWSLSVSVAQRSDQPCALPAANSQQRVELVKTPATRSLGPGRLADLIRTPYWLQQRPAPLPFPFRASGRVSNPAC